MLRVRTLSGRGDNAFVRITKLLFVQVTGITVAVCQSVTCPATFPVADSVCPLWRLYGNFCYSFESSHLWNGDSAAYDQTTLQEPEGSCTLFSSFWRFQV